jgi:hypothetical protein
MDAQDRTEVTEVVLVRPTERTWAEAQWFRSAVCTSEAKSDGCSGSRESDPTSAGSVSLIIYLCRIFLGAASGGGNKKFQFLTGNRWSEL